VYKEMAGHYDRLHGEDEGMAGHELFNDKAAFKHRDRDIFIYWDGRDRWIISPELGAKVADALDIGGPWGEERELGVELTTVSLIIFFRIFSSESFCYYQYS
jgi:hypothetical protein